MHDAERPQPAGESAGGPPDETPNETPGETSAETPAETPADPAAADLYDLRRRYLELTRVELPAAARAGRWCVREDHCFMRILLDHVFGGCWYHRLDRRLVAYKQLDAGRLGEAIALGERLLAEGEGLCWTLNVQSLRWRGKVTTF